MKRDMFSRCLGISFSVLFLVLSTASAKSTGFQLAGRVDSDSLAHAVASPYIYAFDLSPTGQTLALLVRSGDLASDIPTWLLVVNAKSGKVLQKVETGNFAGYWEISSYIPPQVLFTPDGKYLVVQEMEQVRIMEVTTLRTTRTVEGPKDAIPVSVCRPGGNDVFAVSFARDWQRKSWLAKTPVHVEMVDVATGAQLGSWDADDVPQSLSPDGKLAAVSDWEAGGSLLKLAVVNTSSGKKLASLDGGFEFKKPLDDRVIGRVAGRFLSSKQLVLSPDENFDRSGHPSGDSLRIVDIQDGKVVQELKPRRFWPTGDLKVARNGGEIVTSSWHLTPTFHTHPHETMPPGSAPALLVFVDKGLFELSATIDSLGGGTHVLGSAMPFRISSDGSVIAVAQQFGIAIFERAND